MSSAEGLSTPSRYSPSRALTTASRLRSRRAVRPSPSVWSSLTLSPGPAVAIEPRYPSVRPTDKRWAVAAATWTDPDVGAWAARARTILVDGEEVSLWDVSATED